MSAGKHGAVLRVHVQPGAAREGIVGVHGASLKLKVRAPAASGKANQAVLDLLARALGVAPAGLSITSGASSRDKRVLVAGAVPGDLLRALASSLREG